MTKTMKTTKTNEPRESVTWFASIMEIKLKMNDHKGGWADESDGYLIDRLSEEKSELHQAIVSAHKDPNDEDLWRAVISEAVDVANFAMMIADNARGYLRKTEKK